METALRHFAARQEHRSSDSTFLVFMSHGDLDGICGTKHNEEEPDILHDDTIFQIFNNRNCCSLRDKPKIIIIQACRGSESELGEPREWRAIFSISLVSSLHFPRDGSEKQHFSTTVWSSPGRIILSVPFLKK